MQLMSFGSVPTQFTLSISIGAVPCPNVADACGIATKVSKREIKIYQFSSRGDDKNSMYSTR